MSICGATTITMTRWATVKRKVVDFYRECRLTQREGPAYFALFAILMIIATPFLLLEVSIYLVSGKDIGWFPVSEDRVQPSARTVSTACVIDMMEQAKRPALHLVGTSRAVRSRIGGTPVLPAGFQWPHWNDAPLAFLAQIDLAEIGRRSVLPGLPTRGLLYFFYDQKQSTWGFNPADKGSWQVCYSTSDVPLQPTNPPASVTNGGRYAEKHVEFREVMTYPSIERGFEEPLDLSEESWDVIDTYRTRPFAGLPRHQVGGLPSPVQGDGMELECQLASNGIDVGDTAGYANPDDQALRTAAEDWLLLMQLDSDDDTGMMWGDVGILYFWIRKQDLESRNFSDCWMVLQCA